MIEKVLHREMPYFSQWISGDLIGDIVSGRLAAEEDPLWELSGAESPGDYELWARNICGMACLKMILSYWGIDSPPLIPLAKECARSGGYKVKGDDIEGLFYVPFVSFIRDRFDLEGASLSPLSREDIVRGTLEGHLFIVSVHYSIREGKPDYAGPRGGHLVVVSGVDVSRGCFAINNPSGTTEETQRNFKVDFALFERYFAGRGIRINRPLKSSSRPG